MLHVPSVGIVVTTSPSFSLYRVVVLPAASRPAHMHNGYCEGWGIACRDQNTSSIPPAEKPTTDGLGVMITGTGVAVPSPMMF